MTSDPTSEVVRGRNAKNRYYSHFEGRTWIRTTKRSLFEAMEAMEAVEATEIVEATELRQ